MMPITVNDIVIRGVPVGGYLPSYRPVLEHHRGLSKAHVDFHNYLQRERQALGLPVRPIEAQPIHPATRQAQIACALRNASTSGIVGRVWIEDPLHPATL
jgi:hypothetical protein